MKWSRLLEILCKPGILYHFLQFLKSFSPVKWLVYLSFSIGTILLCYIFHLPEWLRIGNTPIEFLKYTTLFTIAGFTQLLLIKKDSTLHTVHFLPPILFIASLIALKCTTWFPKNAIKEIGTYNQSFSHNIPPILMDWAIKFLFIGLPAAWFYLKRIKKSPPLNKTEHSGLNKNWLFLLLLMVALLVILGAQFPAIQEYYPIWKKYLGSTQYQNHWPAINETTAITSSQSQLNPIPVFLFEIIYAADLFTIEVLFRGLIGYWLFKRWGKEGILMAAYLYAMIHLQKPAAEAISSLAGGIILHWAAVRFQTIQYGLWGHLGFAWGMELILTF